MAEVRTRGLSRSEGEILPGVNAMSAPAFDPTGAIVLALFTGVIPHDVSLFDLKDKAGREQALAAANVPSEPDPDIEQMAAFLRMLATAARLEQTILVDG